MSVGFAGWQLFGPGNETYPKRGAAASAVAPTPTPVFSSAITSPATEDPAKDSVPDPAVVAFHETSIDMPLIAIAQQAGDPAALKSFPVRLAPDRFAEVDVTRFEAISDDEGIYSGAIRGQRDSQAVFSYVGLAHAGTVVLPAEERAFYITATETGQMRITELDLTRAPLCGQPLLAQMTETQP